MPSGEGWRERPIRILDIGTGTGCLLLTLLAELPLATGLGTDISGRGPAMAARNAASLGAAERVRFARVDALGGVDGRFDLIVSNPPYIPSGDIAGLDPEVRQVRSHAPPSTAGADGLDVYRKIVGGPRTAC